MDHKYVFCRNQSEMRAQCYAFLSSTLGMLSHHSARINLGDGDIREALVVTSSAGALRTFIVGTAPAGWDER